MIVCDGEEASQGDEATTVIEAVRAVSSAIESTPGVLQDMASFSSKNASSLERFASEVVRELVGLAGITLKQRAVMGVDWRWQVPGVELLEKDIAGL